LLAEVNNLKRKIVYILERKLTFLMSHAESIIVQVELDADTPSMEVGVQSALNFDPDIMYVADIRPNDALPSVAHAMASPGLTVLSSVSIDGTALVDKLSRDFPGSRELDPGLIQGKVKVMPGREGKLLVTFLDSMPRG
jgi:Tfp pilus assembly pilus retraction ATPase PilT